MGSSVTTRQPAEVLSVVDEEVVPCKLMRVEEVWRDAQGQERDPEVQEPYTPDGASCEEQHEPKTCAHVDRGTGESRVEDTEGDAGSGEATTGTNVSSTTERQVGEERVGVDLADEDLEDR